ncbi:Protein farnesyltransferase subunit beta [Platanthera guangdongensis]|uniref:Protein farnesyltransferase subunit beta n=1 Tax=Platanthera guangdongensis TaxID=2320717 RepID=A0ABR2MDD6_9ASPA
MDPVTFDRDRHVAFLEILLERLPEDYESQEINRLTLAYFIISSLSVLDALDRVNTDQLVSWVMSFQIHARNDADLQNGLVYKTSNSAPVLVAYSDADYAGSLDDRRSTTSSGQFYGFGGSTPSNTLNNDGKVSIYNCSHLASTYCALAILKLVGYSFSNVNIDPILVSMRVLQMPNGSFIPTHNGAEADLRFVFCAAAICFMLNNWTGMDKLCAREYILKCQSYDGGFSLVPGAESHGGATYCAVAALYLMGFVEVDALSKASQPYVIDMPLLVEWSLQRQSIDGGFQGRVNKPSDTCYAFWVGAVLKLLGSYHFCNREALRIFLLSCQSKFGGFKKFPDIIYPDLYHSFYGYAALSLLEETGLKPLQVELGIPALNSTGI